jgi:tetratricopeptide (TPR) repeat protein
MGKTRRKNEPQENKIPPATPPADLKSPSWLSTHGWLLPLLLALIVNADVLLNGYAWDDAIFSLEQNDAAQAIEAPALSPDAYYRPLINGSYRLDQAIWGLHPFGFHLSVYLAHALTTLFFYGCATLLLRLYRMEERIAVAAASLFAVHPIHAEAVAWISGRSDIYMALFALIALFAYLQYRLQPSRTRLLIFGIGMVLGLLSKETAIPFFLIIPAFDLLLHRSGIIRSRGVKDPLIRIWAVLLGAFILYRLIHVGFPATQTGAAGSAQNGLLVPLIALGYYLKLLVIPHPLNLFVGKVPDGSAGVFYLVIGLIGLVVLTVELFRNRTSLRAAGAAWFVLGLAAPLIVPFTKVSITPIAERYAYLASGGFLLWVCIGLFEGRRWFRKRAGGPGIGPWMPAGLGLVIALFSYLTWERNGVWRNEISLWEDTVRKSPQIALLHFNLANVYRREGRPKDAEISYRTALQLEPTMARAHFNLGVVKEEQDLLDEAVQEYQSGLKITPNDALAHKKLANILSRKGHAEEAQREYETALTLQPTSAVTHYNVAVGLSNRGRIDEAIKEFQAAIGLDAAYQNAHYNLGLAYANQGRFQEAIVEFQTVVRLKPDDVSAHAVLGDIYKDQGQPKEAIDQYQAALRLDPQQAEIHYTLGVVYGRAGRREDARKEYQEALRIKPDLPAAREALLSLPKE